jgi:hypothetical protein
MTAMTNLSKILGLKDNWSCLTSFEISRIPERHEERQMMLRAQVAVGKPIGLDAVVLPSVTI